jgi:hypothetical protein
MESRFIFQKYYYAVYVRDMQSSMTGAVRVGSHQCAFGAAAELRRRNSIKCEVKRV